MRRAREALEFYSGKLIQKAVVMKKGGAAIDMKALENAPVDIRIRVIRQVVIDLGDFGYGARLDALEDHLEAMFDDFDQAKRFTLANYLFTPDHKKSLLLIAPEKARA